MLYEVFIKSVWVNTKISFNGIYVGEIFFEAMTFDVVVKVGINFFVIVYGITFYIGAKARTFLFFSFIVCATDIFIFFHLSKNSC